MNEVIVGNIGTVYVGLDDAEADRVYYDYCSQSESVRGSRAYGETVTWMKTGGTYAKYHGHLASADKRLHGTTLEAYVESQHL